VNPETNYALVGKMVEMHKGGKQAVAAARNFGQPITLRRGHGRSFFENCKIYATTVEKRELTQVKFVAVVAQIKQLVPSCGPMCHLRNRLAGLS
jgi:hypothetical protein